MPTTAVPEGFFSHDSRRKWKVPGFPEALRDLVEALCLCQVIRAYLKEKGKRD